MASLASNINNLPRELKFLIIKKLDIDSRRALGIYCKLPSPPSIFTHKIKETFFKVRHTTFASILPIGPIRGSNRIQHHTYHIIKAFGGYSGILLNQRVDYIPSDFPPSSLIIYLLDD